MVGKGFWEVGILKLSNTTFIDLYYSGMIRCYVLLGPMFPEATDAMIEIVNFVRQHLRID